MTGKEIYDSYLLSQHWHDLREAAFSRAKRRCETCAAKPRHGHHLIYRTPLESCTVEDIMALCERCHNVWHDWLKQNGYRVNTFCRQSTRGAILALIYPMRVVAPRQHYMSPTAAIKRISKSEAKEQRRELKRQRKKERAAQHQKPKAAPPVVAQKPTPHPKPDIPPAKSEKRQIREAKYQSLLSDPFFKQALDTFSRERFKKFVHEWAIPKYQEFGGWNSLLSTAIAMHDRVHRKREKTAVMPSSESAPSSADEPF